MERSFLLELQSDKKLDSGLCESPNSHIEAGGVGDMYCVMSVGRLADKVSV